MSKSSPSVAATLLDQRRKQIDAEAHIAGFDDAGMARGGLDLVVARLVDAGRADHMHDARLRRQFGQGQRRLRHGEIDKTVDEGEERQRIVGDRDAERARCRRASPMSAPSDGRPWLRYRPRSRRPGVSCTMRVSTRPMRPRRRQWRASWHTLDDDDVALGAGLENGARPPDIRAKRSRLWLRPKDGNSMITWRSRDVPLTTS